MHQVSWQVLVLGGLVAASVPVAARILLSPIALFILSPAFLFGFVIFAFTSNIGVAWILASLGRTKGPHETLRHAARPLIFSTPAAWQAVLIRSKWSSSATSRSSHPPLLPDSPDISNLLEEIIENIIRDFVLVWYSKISPSTSFPSALDDTIHSALTIILSRVELLDLPSLIVHRILPKITSHVERFRQSEMALRGVGIERHLSQSDELDLLLASRYAGKGGKLHPAVENLSSPVTKQTEQAHLRMLVEKVLPLVIPDKEIQSQSVMIVAREIIACVVLSSVTEMLADPDFWNKTIDQAAGAAIRQQKLISKVRNILEAQSATSSGLSMSVQTGTAPKRMENITSRTAARQFDSFIQSINRCDSLLDARRLKNDVVGEIRRTRILLANHENEELINGEKASDVVAYLDRLYNAKRHVESRIALLGGADDDDGRQSVIHDDRDAQGLSLRDVLSSPTSLSYFMEFMDRRDKSLPVQFWLTVETFKNPLEDVESDQSDSEPSDDDPISGLPGLPSASATIRGDMTMIDELYFSNPSSLTKLGAISQRHIDAVKAYVHDPSRTASAVREKKVRNSVLLAQREVQRAMEEDFQDFKTSELWFKVVSDSEANGKSMNPAPPLVLQSPAEPSPSASIIRPSNLRSRTGNSRPTFIIPPKPLARTDTAPPATTSPSAGSIPSPLLADAPQTPLSGSTIGMPTPKPSGSNLTFLISPGNEAPRAPLFDDDDEGDGVDPLVQQETIDALQAALTDIIATENESIRSGGGRSEVRRTSFGSDGRAYSPSLDSSAVDIRHSRRQSYDGRPSSQIFEDEDEDRDHLGQLGGHGPIGGSVQIAAPGDLQLSYEIERLTEKISKLQAQETILDALTRKAELTGDGQELKILHRSKASMEREMRELSFQRSQYEQQESDNRLVPERTRIAITNSTSSADDPTAPGKQVVRYFVEVQQLATDGTFASGWIVARRYNEFWSLHQKLRDKFVMVRTLEFPPKRLVTSLSNSFVDTRRSQLEKYMQALIKVPLVCESDELRSFLSRTGGPSGSLTTKNRSSTSLSGLIPGQGLVRNMYRSVAESIDDMFFGPSMLDVMIQRLNKQAAEFAGIAGSGVHDEDLIEQALKAKSKSQGGELGRTIPPEETLLRLSSGDLKPLEGESGLSSFTAPICDLILAVFELDKKNNWLRKQAVVIILQQVLGGTIERKLKEVAKAYLDEPHLLQYVDAFKNIMWPGGSLKGPSEPRTAEEKIRTRDEANRKLSTLMPDLAANMIGRSNARRGARRIFTVLQNKRLNQHIVYSVIDEVFAALFPEANIL
ncbi:Intermediate filament protein [Tulasnella sp. 425]|nr:Intermediate filament protein [Tulasnella sp. 425]